MKIGIIAGSVLITVGIAVFAYYGYSSWQEREARELLTEGKLVYERGTRDAVNDSIGIFSRVVARYPGTPAEAEACYYIARSYETLDLNRLAYLKYLYILKNNPNLNPALKGEVFARIGRLKVMRRYTEEGISQLLEVLRHSDNREFRSRIYTELGHTYLQMRDYERSKRMFDIALAEYGDNEEAIIGKARACKRLGQDESAYNIYDYYLRYYGNFSPYAGDIRQSYIRQVYRSGHARYRKGEYRAAIAFFMRIVDRFPEDPEVENALYWIGQSHFAMRQYNSALSYFNKVLNNGYGHKDQEARIRRGYAYFLMKQYDLAAREFQLYLNAFPRGKYAETARTWKSMSTQEMLYRINNRMIPDEGEEESPKDEESKRYSEGVDTKDRAMTGPSASYLHEDIEFENVGEL